MPQVPVDKTFFSFVGGLNTEASPLNFPEGTSLDEQNFEMKLNGARRRRKGLARESGHIAGSLGTYGTYDSDMAMSAYRWTNVGGDPDRVFICVQVGTALLFATEAEDLSPEFYTEYVDLTNYNTTGDNADITNYPLAMAGGRGYLFVTGRFIEPFYVSYDSTTDTFETEEVRLYIRDFVGVDDGIPLTETPTVLTDDHAYNLRNRGFLPAFITSYFTDEASYPSKNMIPWKGQRRLIDITYADIDGIKQFDSDKLLEEGFGDSSAPTGKYVINPFDTAAAKLASGTLDAIEDWTATPSGAYWSVTVDLTGHSISASDTIQVVNNQYRYLTTTGLNVTGTLDGTYTVNSVVAATSITFLVAKPTDFSSFVDQFVKYGYVGTDVFVRSDAYFTYERPQAVAFHAGRIFWAGAANQNINDTVFFTQIVRDDTQFGLCYQQADPTSEFINALTPADGGTIVIPGMGQCYKMIEMESALVLFCQNGVWAILPTTQGGFRADGYIVRKISDVECVGPQAVCKIDSTATYCSPRGIYVLVPDPNSGYLNATSISEGTIQTLWNSIPDARQREIQVCYDDSKKRVYYLYGDSSVGAQRTYNRAIVFDARLSAFYKLTFPHSGVDSEWKIRGILATGLGDATDSYKKIKFLGTKDASGITVDVYDFDQEDYTDFDGEEQDAYIVTGYDNLGDFARHRQAPVCHVYLHKTETGYEEALDGSLTPVGESSCWMQARWDWADHLNSGKFGSEQEVYRHVRYYQPTGASDGFDSGLPVIVTRNKLRGRGRCLHLKFRADEGKDCYILGWALEYKGERKQ